MVMTAPDSRAPCPVVTKKILPLQKRRSSGQATRSCPLVVDLDGTLVKTDLLLESLLILLKQNLLYIFVLPLWLRKGRVYLKQQIAQRVTLDVSVLPYHDKFIDYLNSQHAQGRRLILATATDARLACQVADHLKLFETVLASNGTTSLTAASKRDRLVAAFGEQGFDYAGNDRGDLAVWSSARRAVVVNPARRVRSAAAPVVEVEQVFENRAGGIRPYVRALRLHQWLKNLLLFVPLLAEHQLHDTALFAQAGLACVAFGLCASSVYLLNDLLDLQADRHHPRKRLRPFAAGQLSLIFGLVLIPVLLGCSGVVSGFLPRSFLGTLAVYYGMTLAYSFYIKRIVLLDVVVLAGLYTTRIMAGAAAVSVWPPSWLLAFSTLLFLSLGLVKRYAELSTMRTVRGETARARNYHVNDKELLASLGSVSGYVAVLALALYIIRDTAQTLHSWHGLIWLLCPLLLYWISHVWLMAQRGAMHDDPLVFVLKDPVSRVVTLLTAATLMVAA